MFCSGGDISLFMKQIADILRISNQFGVFGGIFVDELVSSNDNFKRLSRDLGLQVNFDE